ncbi:hypothetical protein CYY_000605 [Polysphondylium violaceum]|uniref:Uncharacterized protein n=1 Tax=Polysphondylium violaceum TaxID=133409 RepID=A0A8J4Q4G5_9MYCE|nr:hypothetical protein CYY_000605 [Polysphondylium violaceum]
MDDITYLFFQTIRNKYLFQSILCLCKTDQDEIGYNYYDIPMGYLCRKNRWKIFDDKLNNHIKTIGNQSVPLYENKHHLINFTSLDVKDFFTHNKSFARFTKIWDCFKSSIENNCYCEGISILQLSTQVNADIEIIEKLSQVKDLLKSLVPVSIGVSGSIQIFEFFRKRINLDLLAMSLDASVSQSYDLAKHIIDLHCNQDPHAKFPINRYPLEIVKYLWQKVKKSNLRISRLPPDYQDTIDFFVKDIFAQENNQVSYAGIQLDFLNSGKIGNIQLLNQMLKVYGEEKLKVSQLPRPNHWSECTTTEALDFFIFNFPTVNWDIGDFAAKCKDLRLLKFLVEERDYDQFSPKVWDSSFEVLRYLSSYFSLLPPYAMAMNDIQIDIRIIKLLYKLHPKAVNNSLFQSCIGKGSLECVEFFLLKSIGNITVESFKKCLDNFDYKMFTMLKEFLCSTDKIKFDQIRTQLKTYVVYHHIILEKMIQNGNYNCIELVRELMDNQITITSGGGCVSSLQKKRVFNLIFNSSKPLRTVFQVFFTSIRDGYIQLTRSLIPFLQKKLGQQEFLDKHSDFDFDFQSSQRSLLEIAPYFSFSPLVSLKYPLFLNYKIFTFDKGLQRDQYIIQIAQAAKKLKCFSILDQLAEMNIGASDKYFDSQLYVFKDKDSTSVSISMTCKLNSKSLKYLYESGLMEVLYPIAYDQNKTLFEY